MHAFLILGFLMCFSLSVRAQYFPLDTAELNHSYREYIAEPDNPVKQKAFFEAFPSSFKEFTMIYQYVPDPGYDLSMYNRSFDQVNNGLAKLDSIPEEVYCRKLIQLGINGRWEADAPNYLQAVLHQTMKKHPNTMLVLLREMESYNSGLYGIPYSFWFFYFNGLHKTEKEKMEYEKVKAAMQNTYPRQVAIMTAAYKASCGKAVVSDDFPHLERR